MSKKKQHARFYRMNWDAQYFADLFEGTGFTITEPAEVTIDGTKQKSLYGPQSPLYGSTYEDDQAFIERYRCSCGTFKSRQFEGEICPICHTPVEARDSDINVTGWITLGDNRIVNPWYYNKFISVIGKKEFPDIISAKYKISKNGIKLRPKEEDLDTEPSSPFYGIGIDEFYERYEEILLYFKNKKKNKSSSIDLLLKEKNKAFTSHIPVMSTMLRPQSATSDTFYYNTIDKHVNTIFSLSENLKNCMDVERDLILGRLQFKVNTIWNIAFDLLNGKSGLIRNELMGGSLNNTARNVIVPAPDLKDDEIDISYQTFLELFKYKIIYYIMKLEDINLSKAYNIWKKATKFDQDVYDIMMFLVQHADIKVLINRNPTLIINLVSLNLLNCWELHKGQSAAN